jgi:DNA-binding NtrC family response regulator
MLELRLPPLRDRAGDVAELTRHFVRRFGGATPPTVSDAALAALERHPWPCNVAELRLVIEGAVARATQGVIEPAHLGLP